MTQTLPRSQSAYLAGYMAKVSRSFAIVAPEVEAPMDDYLGVAYLICRVVDNIEDAEQPFEWKRARFAEFESLLVRPEDARVVLSAWEVEAWPGLSADEEAMMGVVDGLPLWEIYAGMPSVYQAPVAQYAREMAQGMCRSVDPTPQDFFHDCEGVRVPLTPADYNLYCYYVAGTVGSMITDMMVTFYGIDTESAVALRAGSQTCGRALQKTNIVKDFARDLSRGFSFLPQSWLAEVDYAPLHLAGAPADWKQSVLRDVLAELDGSVSYVVGLPQRALGFRKAGLLMLLPAYETLLLAASKLPDLFTERHAVKISRPLMMQLIAKTQRVAGDDDAIRALARTMSDRVGVELAQHG